MTAYCCADAEFEGEGAEHSPTCPEREPTLFDLPDSRPQGGPLL